MRRIVSVFILVTVLTLPASTRADDILFGVEAGLAIPVGDWSDNIAVGPDVGLRAGYSFSVPGVRIVIEAMYNWVMNPYDQETDSDGHASWALTGGARVCFGSAFVTYLFAHIGWGVIEAEGSDWVYHDDGLVIDIGVALNFESVPYVNFGIWAAFRHLEHSEVSNTALPTSNQWFCLGVQVEADF